MKKVWDRILLFIIATLFVTGGYFGSLELVNQTRVESNKVESSVTSAIDLTRVTKEENVTYENNEEVVEEESSPASEYYEPVYQESAPQEVGNRIQIGGVLNSPLMNDDGSYFYLDHNVYGYYDGLGVPFIDYRTDFNTRKTIIYAHSSTMGNGPFQVLQNYHNNRGFYDANRYITVIYEGNTYTYEIFSVYVSVAEDAQSEGLEYFYNMNYTSSSWGSRIQWYKDNSEYDTGVEVSSDDKILILQTCSMDPNYYDKYYRYNLLVMGKLI